jgi:hypothetical protein
MQSLLNFIKYLFYLRHIFFLICRNSYIYNYNHIASFFLTLNWHPFSFYYYLLSWLSNLFPLHSHFVTIQLLYLTSETEKSLNNHKFTYSIDMVIGVLKLWTSRKYFEWDAWRICIMRSPGAPSSLSSPIFGYLITS